MNREKEILLKTEAKIKSCEEELKNSLESESRQTQLFATFEKRKIEVAQSQKQEKQQLLQNFSDEKELIKAKMDSSKSEISNSEKSLAEITSEINQLVQFKKKNEYHFDVLTQELTSNQTMVGDKRKILDEVESKVLILSEHVTNRKNRFEEENSNRLEDEKFLQSASEKISSTKNLVENFRSKIAARKLDVEKLTRNVENASDHVKSRNVEIHEISTELDHIQKTINESSLRSEKFRGSIDAKISHTDFTIKCQEELKNEIGKIRCELLQYNQGDSESKLKIHERVKELETELDHEKSQNSAALEEKNRMEEKLRLTRAIYNDLKVLLLECMSNQKSVENENLRLKSSIRDSETDSNQILISIQREKSQFSQLENAVKGLEEKIEKETPLSQEVDLTQTDENQKNLEEELTAVENEIKNLKNELRTTQTQDSQILDKR